jgi:aminopeptidase-like protein
MPDTIVFGHARGKMANRVGAEMYGWARNLWPVTRSLTGDGVRQTLRFIQTLLADLEVHEVATGTPAFDWAVPDEWNISEAWVEDVSGQRIIDIADSNLHVVGYSEPMDRWVDRDELESHLHSLPDQPDAIPYVTSYYRRTWGFCITHEQRLELGDGPFRSVIKSTLEPGHLTYADAVLPGASDEEVLLSTYVCHPSMANNELSGPVVTTAIARWLASLPERRYTYRFVFAPETIGSLLYMSRHLSHLKEAVIAGWVVTCIGDERCYSYVPSRLGGTLADRVSLQVLKDRDPVHHYSFLDRGSDERQWCSPGADLPICSVMRSKYGRYPEYHTSLDDLDLVTPAGLQGGYDLLRSCIQLLETNRVWTSKMPGEPQMGRRGLYPTTSFKGGHASTREMMNVLAYCDGEHDLLDLCDVTGLGWRTVRGIIGQLYKADVIAPVNG